VRGQQNALARREIGSALNTSLSHAAIVDRSVPVSYILQGRRSCLHPSAETRVLLVRYCGRLLGSADAGVFAWPTTRLFRAGVRE
jgi:hypothetical protein